MMNGKIPTGSHELSPRLRFLCVALGVFTIMLDGFDMQAIGFVGPELVKIWHQPLASFAPVFSAGLFGSMAGAMAAGMVVHQIGRRNGLVAAVALFGVTVIGSAFVPSVSSLSILRFLTGLAVGISIPMVMALIADIAPERTRATLVIVALCGQPIGAIIGSALCAHFLPLYGWRFAFLMNGVLAIVLAPTLLLIPRGAGHSEASRSPAGSGLRALFAREHVRTTGFLWGAMFTGVMVMYLVVSWLPGAIRAQGYALDQSALALSLFNGGGLVGALLIGRLVDRFGPLAAPTAGFAIGAACLALFVPSQGMFSLFLVLVSLAGISAYGTLASLGGVTVLLYPPALRPAAAGWALGIGRLGAALGPLLAGVLLSSGLTLMKLFYMAAVLAGLAATCLGMIRRRSADATTTAILEVAR